MALIQLIYCSSARHLMSEAELDEILDASVRHNTAADITGILLYLEGCFIQVLEGEENRVMETYKRVHRDPRHHDVILIDSRPIDTRDFPNWRMGFQRLNWQDIVDRPAYADLRGNRLDGQPLHLPPGIVGQILADFCYR